MTIIGMLFGTMLLLAGVGFTKTSLVNETFAAAPGNKMNSTNSQYEIFQSFMVHY